MEEEYRIDKENRRKKIAKRRKRMKLHGAGLRRIPGIWEERAEKVAPP